MNDVYQDLLNTARQPGSPTSLFIENMGKLVDLATDMNQEEGLIQAITAIETQLPNMAHPDLKRCAHYFLGGGWTSLYRLRYGKGDESWGWEREEIEKEIFHLRSAVRNADAYTGKDDLLPRIYTNLGNVMSHVGRFIEAIDYWAKALEIVPGYGMAIGNLGEGLCNYTKYFYNVDGGVTEIFLHEAHRMLVQALEKPLEGDAAVDFRKHVQSIESRLDPGFLNRPLELDLGHSLGDGEEGRYRKWCLDNKLFLNPLNDLGPHSIAASDSVQCRSVVTRVDTGPIYHGLFSQIKQEYVSARFLFFDGLFSDDVHYSDRRVSLVNTLDFPAFCLSTEKQKLAFRSAYSILDKIAFFLNQYMGLDIPEHEVSIKRIWYEKRGKKPQLRDVFSNLQNWSLRGLFWLAKDIWEDSSEYRNAIEPDAQGLRDIRNHLEHKYLKVHDRLWNPPTQTKEESRRGLSDTLAYSIGREEFAFKGMKMLRLARAALMYLAFGIQEGEARQVDERRGKRILPMLLDDWEDEWKR